MNSDSTHKNPSNAGNNHSRPALSGWWAVILAVLACSAMLSYWYTSTQTVQSIHFTGHYFEAEEALRNDLPPLKDANIDSLNYLRIIEKLERRPYVKEASVNIQPKGNLLISIAERQPIALLNNNGNRCYVDTEGVKLPLQLSRPVDVPILYGFDARQMQDTLSGPLFGAARNFLLEVQKQPFVSATISEIAVSSEEGVVALSHQNGVKLLFGHPPYIEKLTYWQTFYEKVIALKGIGHFASLDFRFKDQIVAREGPG